MQLLRNLPVKQKITAITLFTILVVSLLSSTAYVVIESGRARSAIVDELKTIAGIVADNSTAALVFNDPSSADETLSALKAKTDIIGAAIFRRNGSLFATYAAGSPDYRPLGQQAAKERPLSAGSIANQPASEGGLNAVRFYDGLLELVAPILLDGEVVGTLVLRSNLDQIASSLWTYILIALAVMLFSLGIAFVLISRMQRVISTPIERLRKTMETVSAKQDYTVRAESHGRDELGSVIDGLNHMLAQIQRHEEVQRKAHQQAEAANRAKSEFLANMSHNRHS
jgi:HAMP domain-containing protein